MLNLSYHPKYNAIIDNIMTTYESIERSFVNHLGNIITTDEKGTKIFRA